MHSAPSESGSVPARVRELARFLQVCRGQGPSLLWPEHERPAPDAPDAAAVLDAEARTLETLTDLPVTIECHLAADQGTRPLSTASSGCLLVHQETGAGSWRLLHGAEEQDESGASFNCRLRSGEVLYIPPGWSWQAHLTRNSRLLLTRLGPSAAPGTEAMAGLPKPQPAGPTGPWDRRSPEDTPPSPW